MVIYGFRGETFAHAPVQLGAKCLRIVLAKWRATHENALISRTHTRSHALHRAAHGVHKNIREIIIKSIAMCGCSGSGTDSGRQRDEVVREAGPQFSQCSVLRMASRVRSLTFSKGDLCSRIGIYEFINTFPTT